MRMDFRVRIIAGVQGRKRAPEFAYNGTFFRPDYFPFVGYNQSNEIE